MTQLQHSVGISIVGDPAAPRFIEANGARVPYIDHGQGEPVVAVHGALSDMRVWKSLGEHLSRGRRFIAYTQRYFGAGPWPDEGAGYPRKTHTADLIAFVEALGAGPVHLVAWSYGGDVAFHAALERPDIFRSIVYYEPSVDALIPETEEGSASRKAFAGAIEPAVAALRAGDAAQAAYRFAEALAGLPAGQAQKEKAPLPAMFRDNSRTLALMLSTPPVQSITRAALKNNMIPTRIVSGERTHARYRLIAEQLAACLGNAELLIMENAGHDGPYRCADAFAALVGRFFDGQN